MNTTTPDQVANPIASHERAPSGRVEWEVGTYVLFPGAKRPGQVVEIRPDGRIRVAMGSLTLVCTSNQLTSASSPPAKNFAPDLAKALRYDRHREVRLDLHGCSVSDAIHRLENTLSDGVMNGIGRLEIVHGFGTGKVLQAVQNYLKESPIVRRFEIDPKNPGITVAYF